MQVAVIDLRAARNNCLDTPPKQTRPPEDKYDKHDDTDSEANTRFLRTPAGSLAMFETIRWKDGLFSTALTNSGFFFASDSALAISPGFCFWAVFNASALPPPAGRSHFRKS